MTYRVSTKNRGKKVYSSLSVKERPWGLLHQQATDQVLLHTFAHFIYVVTYYIDYYFLDRRYVKMLKNFAGVLFNVRVEKCLF